MRARTLLSIALGLAAASSPGCGSDGDGGGPSALIQFSLFRGGQNLPCSEVAGIDRVDVTLLFGSGQTLVSGFPRTAECAVGAFELPAVAGGDYVLDVVARGRVGADANAALFRARSNLSLPSPEPIALSLRPEVAFLELAWTFGDDGLAPCGNEVTSVEVIVSAGTTQAGSFTSAFPCAATPVVVPGYFDLQEYTVRMDALSSEGFPLYSHTARRVLERGENAYTAILTPQGGRLHLDWEFGLGMDRWRDCQADRVRVTEVVATVRSLEGGAPVTERIPCAEVRPFALRAARFSPGRQLELELVAEGRERFRGVERLTMPEGDWHSPRLLLEAVGTATVSIQVETSSCATAAVQGWALRVSGGGGRSGGRPPLELRLPPEAEGVVLEDLPYGDYDVHLAQILASGPGCFAEGRRAIRARENDWEPFVF